MIRSFFCIEICARIIENECDEDIALFMAGYLFYKVTGGIFYGRNYQKLRIG